MVTREEGNLSRFSGEFKKVFYEISVWNYNKFFDWVFTCF